MAKSIEVKVPDIGDYDAVLVIEVLVAVGDTVAKDQGLVTLESDKATMEVPSPVAGVIRELKVKLGDNVAEGTVIAVIAGEGEGENEGGSRRQGEGEPDASPEAAGRSAPATPEKAGEGAKAGAGAQGPPAAQQPTAHPT